MTLTKNQNLALLSTVDEIDKEIFLLKKSLFDLRLKRSFNKGIESHLFCTTKRHIAQLKYKKSLINRSKRI